MNVISSREIYDTASLLVKNYLYENKCYANINLPTNDFMVFEWEKEVGAVICNIYLVTDDVMMADCVIYGSGISEAELYEKIVKIISAGCMGKISISAQGVQVA